MDWRHRVVAGMVVLGLLGSLGGLATAQAKPTVTVAADGSAKFTTVQAAVDVAPEQGEVVRIAPGVYKEKLSISKNGVELRGMGERSEDVVLTYDDSAATAGGTGKSGSVTVTGNDFHAENLTIQNDWEKTHVRTQEGSQAVALKISGDREVLRRVRLLGDQDTLYATSDTCHEETDSPCRAARMLFQDCYIAGHVDFIFGDAKAVFDHCELHAMAHPEVTITAQSKLYPLEDSGYLFLDCKITADPGVRELLLGRPWRAYSTVYFVNTRLAATALAPAGWAEWGGRLATSTYAEYRTSDGSGRLDDTSRRIQGTRQLTSAEVEKLTVKAWLAGGDGWNPEGD